MCGERMCKQVRDGTWYRVVAFFYDKYLLPGEVITEYYDMPENRHLMDH